MFGPPSIPIFLTCATQHPSSSVSSLHQVACFAPVVLNSGNPGSENATAHVTPILVEKCQSCLSLDYWEAVIGASRPALAIAPLWPLPARPLPLCPRPRPAPLPR